MGAPRAAAPVGRERGTSGQRDFTAAFFWGFLGYFHLCASSCAERKTKSGGCKRWSSLKSQDMEERLLVLIKNHLLAKSGGVLGALAMTGPAGKGSLQEPPPSAARLGGGCPTGGLCSPTPPGAEHRGATPTATRSRTRSRARFALAANFCPRSIKALQRQARGLGAIAARNQLYYICPHYSHALCRRPSLPPRRWGSSPLSSLPPPPPPSFLSAPHPEHTPGRRAGSASLTPAPLCTPFSCGPPSASSSDNGGGVLRSKEKG